jgi:tetratricopeptide (TPR) repeat protein
MERSSSCLILVLWLLCLVDGNASYKSEIYKAYISNNMGLWEKTIDEMNKQKNKSNDFVLELLNYQYGYIGWCIGKGNNDQAERYLALGEANISLLERTHSYSSIVNSYKSAFYGYRIGLNIFKAPFIGPKSVECAQLAMKQDDNNPYGYIQYGNAQYYMPAAFGGSKQVALDYYKTAEGLMAKKQEFITENWNYLSLLVMIAKAYTELNDYQQAKAYYDKILKIEPSFLWVKNELYPAILKKI